MEAILRSVLLRQEQMAMQWDAEFEQQKQLFHINTSTLIDMLPIRPRKKRPKVEGRVQHGPIPGHDKENLVGFQGFLPKSASVKSPKTKAPYSRGLAKRDLNTRFCDNDVKDVGRMDTKPAEAQPPLLQSALLNCSNAENVQQNGRIVRAVRPSNQVALGVSVKVEVDEGDARQMHVSPPTDDIPSPPGENRKRIRGEQEENAVLQTCIEGNQELSNNPEEGRKQADRMGMVDCAEKKTKSKRARVVEKANENAVQVENQVQTCRDTQLGRSSEPEIVIKVEEEPEVQTCRDAQAVEAIEPEITSRGPARRGRAKGASTVSRAAVKAAVPDMVSKEPTRRGRAKKAPTASEACVPEIAQRVTRSRARKVESVVESEPGKCEEMPATQVASKESAQRKEEVAAFVTPDVEDSSARVANSEPEQGDTVADCDDEGQGRSANQIVEGQMEAFCKPEVCAPPPEEIRPDEQSIKQASHSKERKSVARFAQKDSGISSVACDMEKPGHVRVSSHVDSEEEAASPHSGAEEQSVRIGSRVAEILANIGNASVDHLKDGGHGTRSQPRLGRIEEDLRRREADFAPAEHPLASRREGTEVQDGNAPLALFEGSPVAEETARNVLCLAAPEGDTVVGEVLVETKVPQMQGKGTEDRRHASNKEIERPSAQRLLLSEAAQPLLGRHPTLISDVTSVREISRTLSTNSKEAYTALLSEMIKGSISPLEKLCAPVSSPESVVVAWSRKSSLQSEGPASATVALELLDAGRDASASEVQVLPTAGMTRKSTGADCSVAERDLTLASEGQGTESDNGLEECSIEANIQFAERSWHTKRESVEDVVMNTTSEGSRVKEPENARQSRGGASRIDMNTREQVKSDAVSPVRYSEARAIEEAMRCSLEQEFHPDVTLTLNRWQFRKRLSPRSKARARRWRSDVAINGVDYGRGQSSDAPVASPSRVVSSRDRSMEGAAYDTFLEAQSPNPEVALEGVEPAFSSGPEKAVDQAYTTSWQEHASQPEGIARRSIASLCNEVLSQALQDGEMGGNGVEYEVMEIADENGNLSPLLQSIYKLSKACQNDMVGARGFLEEEEQQQVHSLIESAKKIMEQVSSKRAQAAGAPPRTPASDHPALNNSRFYDHTNLYPDRFRLFITPRSSPAAPPILPPSASIFPVSATPAVVSLLLGDMESRSPQIKHLIQETIEQDVSKVPYLDSILSESVVRLDGVVNPARSRPQRSGELSTTSETGNIHHSGEGENAPQCSGAVGSGSTPTDSIHLSRVVPGTLAIGSALTQPELQNEGALQSCDDSILLNTNLIGAVNKVELVTHQSEFPVSSETMAETDKLSELRSRFYALSKDYVVKTSSRAKDVPDLLEAGPESLINHSTNPPSPIPSLRFSPGYASEQQKAARVSVKKSPQSSKEVYLDAGENGEPAVVMEGETRIPCSPIFIGNQRAQDNLQQDFMTDDSSLSHHGFQKTVTIKEEVVVLEGTSEPSEEVVARTQSIATASAASVLRVEPQCPNLISAVLGVASSSSNLPRSNLVTSMRSFIPLVQQQQPAAPYPNGKRDVKVKALEAAEAAKRLAEQKAFEKQERKKAAELAKREKQERAAQEKLAKREKTAQDKLIKLQEARAEKENEEASKRKAAASGTTKSMIVDSTNCQGTSSQNVLLKVKKTYELKLKMDQDKQERLQEEQRRKEEEWRKKEAENAARKRKHEAVEKKEREEKRRRQEEAVKAHREMEERQRSDLEKKAQKQKALEEMEKERKVIEEELKRQKRLDKEKEVEQRRKKEQEKELAWLDQKETTRKLKEEAAKQMKLLETEGRQQAVKMRRPSEDPAMPSTGPYHSFMASLHIAMGIGEGVGGAHLSGVNNLVDPQRVSSQSLIGHPLRVPQQSAEGAGAVRNSQAALRVPRTTPESAPGVSNIIGGSGKPLFRTPPEALGVTAVASVAVASGGASTARGLRARDDVPQGQSGSKTGASAVAGGSKPCQPGQVGFAGPPGGVIGQGDKGVQSYEISPFRDSEDEDSDDEEKRSQKPIPQWARKENMWPQLVRQLQQDPDDIFVGASSCSLDEVFEVKGSKKRPDFKRRGSSGDWVKDCLTWQEQIQYKVTMGYLH